MKNISIILFLIFFYIFNLNATNKNFIHVKYNDTRRSEKSRLVFNGKKSKPELFFSMSELEQAEKETMGMLQNEDTLDDAPHEKYFNVSNLKNFRVLYWTTLWKQFYQEIYHLNYARISPVVRYFKMEQLRNNWSREELLVEIIKFTQAVHYARPRGVIYDSKRASTYFDFFTPLEFLYFEKGDCDTKSLFLAIVLDRLGYDTIILTSLEYLHAMAGICLDDLDMKEIGSYYKYNGKKYYFIETTQNYKNIGALNSYYSNKDNWEVSTLDRN